jgi:D-alanyl-D-alanine carboxypeptidase
MWNANRMKRRTFALLSAAAALPARAAPATTGPDNAWLEDIRKKHGVPALATGIVTPEGLGGHFWTGVRKAGGTTPVTAADLWHIGSMTKAMTATLLGTWVARGQLRWQATLGNLIPRLLEKATPEVRGITLEQLLTHRSGFRANREPWSALPAAGSRSQIVRIESARPLEHPPGSASLYSNLGYMIAGVVAETLGGKIWSTSCRSGFLPRSK